MRERKRGNREEGLLFLHLTDFRFHFFEIWICFPLGMRQWFFDHKEFVQFVCHIKICFFHLRNHAHGEYKNGKEG